MPDPPNVLERYRRAQRRLRRLFAPFTTAHCPTCLTPCCRKPTWVRPVDLILVQELGYRPASRETNPVGLMLDTLTGPGPADAGAPCDFLGESGCTFPPDLRPFGCAAAICDPMRRLLPPAELARLERAVAELTAAHTELMELLHSPSGAETPDPDSGRLGEG
jgi:hypothetical protein